MKRHLLDKKYFSLLKMLDDFAQSDGKTIYDELVLDKFVERLSKAVQQHRDNPIRVHGFRVESMFAHISAALSKCRIITEEDSGALFSIDEDIRRPDFRIITIEQEQFFVEVKNYHQKDPLKPISFKLSYILTLRKYADAFNIPLKIAIFWSRSVISG